MDINTIQAKVYVSLGDIARHKYGMGGEKSDRTAAFKEMIVYMKAALQIAIISAKEEKVKIVKSLTQLLWEIGEDLAQEWLFFMCKHLDKLNMRNVTEASFLQGIVVRAEELAKRYEDLVTLTIEAEKADVALRPYDNNCQSVAFKNWADHIRKVAKNGQNGIIAWVDREFSVSTLSEKAQEVIRQKYSRNGSEVSVKVDDGKGIVTIKGGGFIVKEGICEHITTLDGLCKIFLDEKIVNKIISLRAGEIRDEFNALTLLE